MRKRLTSLVLLAGLGLLGACETTAAGGKTADTAAKSKLADVETLQKATALANGNMAWETVDIRRQGDLAGQDALPAPALHS
jgi:hypothetical protein